MSRLPTAGPGWRAVALAPVLALTVALALTGCGRLATQGANDGAAAPTAPAAVVGTPASTPTATDPSTLDSISQDLGAADTANQQADSNATAGDQAAATNDDQ